MSTLPDETCKRLRDVAKAARQMLDAAEGMRLALIDCAAGPHDYLVRVWAECQQRTTGYACDMLFDIEYGATSLANMQEKEDAAKQE